MANLGNLIVRGVTRILGDAYANKFIGNLQGNADTATSAIKASTADSATNAASANKASIATAVQDYGTSDYREIKIGYNGSGLSSNTITHAVGFTDGGTKIKDISKDEFRNWLTTSSGTWPITVSNASNSANAATATKLQTARTIWGQNFDGTGNVSGALTGVTSITASGRATLEGGITSKGLHDFIYNGEEFNFIPDAYSGLILFNYRTASGSFNGNVTEYRFLNGTGSSYSDIRCKNLYLQGNTLQIGSATFTWNDSALVFDKSTRFRSDTFFDNWAYLRTYLTDGTEHSVIGVNNKDILFINDGITVPTIIRGGNVLIGTNTDNGQKLQVAGSILADLGNNGGVLIGHKGNTIDGYYNGTFTDLHLNYTSSDDLTMCIGGGNVGINIISPSYKLHVVGDIYTTTGFKKEGSSNSYVLLGGGGHKAISDFATTSWVNDNFYTYSESDNRYIQSETDPVWTAAKGNYYTKTECDNRYQPKGTYLTEQSLQGYATQEWVRGEEYLYRSGGTMDARAEIGITTKLFIGNSTSPDTCYTKFNCILHGGGDESNPNWVIHDNGYSEFKSSVSANAFYASSDIRLKNILDDINIDFDKLKLIPKKYYTWKGSDILQLGTIAQDIQKIYPEVVSKNENGYLSVDYSKLSIIALAAIDKLNERIKELECQIKL